MTTSNDAPGMLAVTQADREAAATIMPFKGAFQTLTWFGVVYAKCAVLRGDGDDHPTVQAFARHRIAHSLDTGEGRLREALAEVRDLLAERIFGNPARSSAHNARVKLESIIDRLATPANSAPSGGGERCGLSDGEVYSRASFDSADHKRGFLEALATLRPSPDAIREALDLLNHYAAYIREVPSSELERHPYLPSIEATVAALSDEGREPEVGK